MPFSYYNDVSNHLSVPQLVNDVLRAAYAKPNLARPEICPIINVDRLHIRQPSLGQLTVNMGVREYESIGTQTPNTSSRDVELLNDRIAISVSAESQIENYYGDSLQLIAEENGRALAKALELWIVLALKGHQDIDPHSDDEPLRLTANADGEYDHLDEALRHCANLWHHHVVPNTINLLGDWEPSAVCMHPATWAHLQPLFSGATDPSGSNMPYEWADYRIPGFNCPVVTSTYLPAEKIYVVSSDAAAMRCYQYDSMRPVIDYNPAINATVMYAGIWRTVASGFRMTTKPKWSENGNLIYGQQRGNAGIVEITLKGAFFGAFKVDDGGLNPEDFVNNINAATARDIEEFAGKYIRQKVIADVPDEAVSTMKKTFEAAKPAKVA